MRQALDLRRRPVRILLARASSAQRVLIYALFALLVAALPISRLDDLYRALPFDLFRFSSLALAGALAPLLGAALGLLRGLFIRRNAAHYFGASVSDMTSFLDSLRVRD